MSVLATIFGRRFPEGGTAEWVLRPRPPFLRLPMVVGAGRPGSTFRAISGRRGGVTGKGPFRDTSSRHLRPEESSTCTRLWALRAVLRTSWGRLEPFWGHLGAYSGCRRGVVGKGPLLDTSSTAFAPKRKLEMYPTWALRGVLRTSWGRLEPFWGHLGALYQHLATSSNLEQPQATSSNLWQPLAIFNNH